MKLEEYLSEVGMTQVFLAKKLGVSQQTIGNILKGRKLPSLKLAVKIERFTKRKIKCSSWLRESEIKSAS